MQMCNKQDSSCFIVFIVYRYNISEGLTGLSINTSYTKTTFPINLLISRQGKQEQNKGIYLTNQANLKLIKASSIIGGVFTNIIVRMFV